MKKKYILIAILFFNFINLTAQTVTLTGSCDPDLTDGDYILSSDINGRPSFIYAADGGLTIQWSGSRWELVVTSDPLSVGMYNNADTPYPPASSLSPWIGELCNPAGTFSGDGTSTTLSIADNERSIKKMKLFPNPTTDFIKIIGLVEDEEYRIYSTLGFEIKKGIISNNEKLDIQNFNKGMYILNLENGGMFRFLKD